MPPPKTKRTRQTATTTGKGGNNDPSESTETTAVLPNWPPLQYLPPADDLTLTTLLSDQILTISSLWPSSLCKAYLTFLSHLPLTTTSTTPKRGEAVRVNDRFQVSDATFATKLWLETALHEMIAHPVIDGKALDPMATKQLWGGEVLGLNSNVRVYRYGVGQFFGQHYDDSNPVAFPSPNPTDPHSIIPARTTWTLLLYLTSPATGCEGGETVFYPEAASKRDATPPPIVAAPEVGMALLHRHGRECLLHEGRKVTRGEKWILRSDLCVRR